MSLSALGGPVRAWWPRARPAPAPTQQASRPRTAPRPWLTQRQRQDMAHAAALTAGGVALTAVGAAVSAASVTPAALRLGGEAAASLGLLEIVPVVGPAIATVIGASTFSACASAALLATCLGTLMAGQEGDAVGVRWAIAHLAIGFALSPMALMGAGSAGVAAVLAAAALSALVTARVVYGRTSWEAAIWGVALCCALGPAGGHLAAVGSAAAVNHMVRVVASAGLMTAVYGAYTRAARVRDPDTAYLETFQVPTHQIRNARLDLPGEPAPTVFASDPELAGVVAALRLGQARRVPAGMVKVLLTGPSGSGKTRVAAAVANAVGAPLFCIGQAGLGRNGVGGGDTVGGRVMTVFEQARAHARRQQCTVVLFFDEADALFPDRATLAPGSADARGRNDVVNAFLPELDGIHRPPDDNLVVIAATNYPDRFDASIKQRFGIDVALRVPDEATLRRMLANELTRALASPLLAVDLAGIAPRPEQLDAIAARAAARGWVGREIVALAEGTGLALRAAAAKGAWSADASVRRAALDAELDRRCAAIPAAST